jgi:hypothetical protein
MPGHRGGGGGRVAAWRDRFWQRMKATTSDLDRVGVAADHLRLVLAKCATPAQREAIATAAIADLVGPAEELLAHFETHGRKKAS